MMGNTRRGDKCLRCGGELPPARGPQGPARKWCSGNCRYLALREKHPAAGLGSMTREQYLASHAREFDAGCDADAQRGRINPGSQQGENR